MSNSVLTMEENHVLQITLNRPDQHNAFDPKMVRELTEGFKIAAANESLRAVHISGEGKSFCAGADLKWMKSMADYSYSQNLADSKALFDMFDAGYKCSVPIVASVQGNVVGGGLGLLSICDISAVVEGTKFCFSEVRLGLVPAVISPYVLKKMDPSMATEWMLTGKRFSAQEAQQAGLVRFVGTQGEVDEYRNKTMGRLFSCGPQALRETKKLLRFVRDHKWSEVKKETARVIAERRVSDEGQKGLSAFFAQENPDWVIPR